MNTETIKNKNKLKDSLIITYIKLIHRTADDFSNIYKWRQLDLVKPSSVSPVRISEIK